MAKDAKSLLRSRLLREKFLQRLGVKKVPTSILEYDRSDRAMDVTVKVGGRSYGKVAEDRLRGQSGKLTNRALIKIFDVSGQCCRGKDAALSRFPQNVGRVLINFYCPSRGTVFDPFAGHNSRMELVYKSGRNYIGMDVSNDFMEANRLILQRLLSYNNDALFKQENWVQLIHGDSRYVPLKSEFADFTITSPPYWDLEWYGEESEQLGNAKTYEEFLDELGKCLKENYRILKGGSYCVWCVNDFRKNGKFYPYHADVIFLFQQVGFTVDNVYIIDLGPPVSAAFVKTVLQCRSLPKRHEYAIVGRKPGSNSVVDNYFNSLLFKEK